MKVNINHPSFISFLENVSNNILSSVKIDDYFSLSNEKKLTVSFAVLNLLKNTAKIKANLTESELKSFIVVLCKKNEEIENYEFAAVLNDIVKNFDVINDISKPTKRKPKPTKKIDTNSQHSPQ